MRYFLVFLWGIGLVLYAAENGKGGADDQSKLEEQSTLEEQRMLTVLDVFEESANRADPSISEPYLMLDDPRFIEIEDYIPEPFGADMVRKLHEMYRRDGKPGEHVRFVKRRAFLLSPTTGYVVCIQKLNFDKPAKSRVTFLFVKSGGVWKAIHAHYSTMPKKED